MAPSVAPTFPDFGSTHHFSSAGFAPTATSASSSASSSTCPTGLPSHNTHRLALLDAKLPHDDPMSGKACPNVQLARRGLDFVHRFQTDVRLFRFLPAMPGPGAEHTSLRRFHERFARTVSETIRLAAIELR